MDIKKYREWINEEPKEEELLEEAKLSPYWKKRARSRAKNAGRPLNNGVDRKWALEQQEKSAGMQKTIHQIFEKELSENEELSEEITAFLERIKKKRAEQKALEEEKKKAKLEKAKGKRGNKTLPNPYAGEKTTKKFPYGGGKDGGVAKVYRKRMKKAGGMTLAPGEAFGPMEEGLTEAPVKIGSGNAAPRPSQVKAAMKAFGMIPSSGKASKLQNKQASLPGMGRDIQKELAQLNSKQQNNFYKLLEEVPKYNIDGFSSEAPKQILSNFGIDMENLLDLVKEIPSLENNTIESPLFAGTQGMIYNLSNDHVLKLFVGGYQDDLAWYSDIKQKLYTSKGSSMTLPVYDSGKTSVQTSDGRAVKFAEMAKLIPLGSFIEFTGRDKSDANADIDNVNFAVGSIYDYTKDADKQDFLDTFNDELANAAVDINTLTEKEAENLALMFRDFIDRGNMPNDMHSGNIGILPQSNPANPTFVIFDN